MRILIINDSMGIGGAETYVLGLAEILRKKNDVYLFGFSDFDLRENKKLALKNKRGFGRFLFSYRIYKRLINHIKEVKPDLIHLHNNYAYSASVLLALRKFDIPIIQTIHDWGLICPSSWCVIKHNLRGCEGTNGIGWKCLRNRCIKPWHFFITYIRNKLRLRLTKENINAFIAPSKKLKNYLDKFGFKNTIYLPYFKEFNPKIKRTKENIILYVGVLTENKGVEYLIKAMEEINKEISDVKLVIIGDGKEREKLKKLNVKNVEFTGKIDHKEVINYFNKSKLLVVPSIWMENSPLVIYEAMSFELPVIGSNRGGIPDLVKDNKTGFIVEPANSKALAEKVILLLKNESLRKKFGKKGKELIQEVNPEIHLKKLMEIYNKNI